MKGVYRHCKEKHLHRYLAEFDFRYNYRVALGVNDTVWGERYRADNKGFARYYREAIDLSGLLGGRRGVVMSIHVDIDWKKVGQVGLYTVPMAARILHEDGVRLRAWINGAQHSDAPPIIQRQLPQISGQTVFGFLDLIEARFIKHFRDLGLSAQAIRKFAIKLRQRHHADHPFAMNKAFRTDGKVIFMEIAEDEKDKRILNLLNDNFEMGNVIEQSLFASILYADDLAYRWRPSHEQPRVVLDPQFAFGRPTIEGIWIPTDALAEAVEADGDMSVVAEDFEIDKEAVAQAVAYEYSLRAGAVIEDKVR